MRRAASLALAAVVGTATVVSLLRAALPAQDAPAILITQVQGAVEVASRDEVGPAKAGRQLDPSDRLRTGSDGRALLSVGQSTQVKVGPEASVLVRDVQQDGVRLELEGGELEATVRPDSPSLRVTSDTREVVATDATFRVASREGVLAVETQEGEVSLTGVLPPLRVGQGEQATVVGKSARLGQVPVELLLEVQWPADRRTKDLTQEVTGTTHPGAQVEVRTAQAAIRVQADAEGLFRAEVPLQEGENAVSVQATDPLGHRSPAREGALGIRDTTAAVRGGVEYGP